MKDRRAAGGDDALQANTGLTQKSLQQWAAARDISPAERQDRQALCSKILGQQSGFKKLMGKPFSVKGFLDLAGLSSLTSLPPGLRAKGGVNLSGCTALRELPNGFSVSGDLKLVGCTSLLALPADMHVGGALDMQHCTRVQALPPTLVVAKNIIACHCTALEALSGPIAATGIDASGCTALRSVTGDFPFQGGLLLKDCTALSEIEGTFSCHHVDLSGCEALTSLRLKPREGTDELPGSLTLRDCIFLSELPAELRLRGDLDLTGCISITALPVGLSGENIILDGLPDLKRLPERMEARVGLTIKNCAALIDLPQEISARSLTIRDCAELTSLPPMPGLRTLEVEGCPRLVSLPEGLALLSLTLRDSVVTALPTSLTVESQVLLQRCSCAENTIYALANRIQCSLMQADNLESGQYNLQRTCSMLLEGAVSLGFYESLQEVSDRTRFLCGGSPDIDDQFPDWARDPINLFKVTYTPSPEYARYASGPLEHRSLETAWTFWQMPDWTASQSERQPALPRLNGGDRAILLNFLNRLQSTADYENPVIRPMLVHRVRALGELLVRAAASDQVMTIIHDAMTSCRDRLIRGLDEIEMQVRVRQAMAQPDDGVALQALAASLIKLEVVHAAAAAVCERSPNDDPVEVYLAFETRLGTKLGLPINTRQMLYAGYAPSVTHADIERAEDAANRAAGDPARIEIFLKAWEPWQRHLRQAFAKQTQWPALAATVATAAQRASACVITQEPFADLNKPVAIRGSSLIAEFAPLLRWWVEHGTDPTNQPLDFADVTRLIDRQDGNRGVN